MESSNNYRKRRRRIIMLTLSDTSRNARPLRRRHRDFQWTAKYVGIDSTCPKILSSAVGETHDSTEVRFLRCTRRVRCRVTNRVKERKRSHTVRQRERERERLFLIKRLLFSFSHAVSFEESSFEI